MTEIKTSLNLAEDARVREDYDAEIKFLTEALHSATDEADRASIYEKLGTSQYLAGKRQEAKRSLFHSLETLSDLPKREAIQTSWLIHDYLGLIFFDEEDYERALYHKLKAYEAIDDMKPKDALLLILAIGVIYERLEKYDKAIEFYLKALGTQDLVHEDESLLLKSIGYCYDKKGEDRKAFKYYYKLFLKDASYNVGWYIIYRFGQLSYRFNNYDDSINFLQKALPLIPSNKISHLQTSHRLLGYAYLAKKDYKQALEELEKANKVRSCSPDERAYILCGIAQVYFALNKTEKAIKWGEKALEIDLDEVVRERIYYILAYSHFLRRNRKQGKYYFGILKRDYPASGYLKELEKDWANQF